MKSIAHYGIQYSPFYPYPVSTPRLPRSQACQYSLHALELGSKISQWT